MPVFGHHQTQVGPRWRPFHFAVTALDLSQPVPRVRTACGRFMRGRYTRDPQSTQCQQCRKALAKQEA
jgi:hypothetical protein